MLWSRRRDPDFWRPGDRVQSEPTSTGKRDSALLWERHDGEWVFVDGSTLVDADAWEHGWRVVEIPRLEVAR